MTTNAAEELGAGREEPAAPTPAAPLPAAAPRLGQEEEERRLGQEEEERRMRLAASAEINAAAYMPAAMLPLANVHIRLDDGSVLPAHSHLLALASGALGDHVPGFSAATPAAPLTLSQPFSNHAREVVVGFLREVYSPYCEGPASAVADLGVLQLAHALDAAALLERAQGRARGAAPVMALEDAAEFAEFAARGSLAELLAACQVRLAQLVRNAVYGGDEHAMYSGFLVAARLVELCGKKVLAGVIGALGRVTGIPNAADILLNTRRVEAQAAQAAAAAQ